MPDFDPALLSAEDMLGYFGRRQLTPVDVLQAITERVARLNPGLNAFAVMNPGALQAAGESTSRWRSGRPLGMLDGVPCTVKDLVDLAGFPTRRGSRTTSTDPVPDDAPLVAGLKAAGAVIVGKTTTTEFGWKSPGDCPLHGITRNPWNPDYTTGGSSSGAGAAGAAGFGPLHVGTDAGGSVRIPAAWCGLVGLKPTYGRIPQWPASAFASVSCAGPMTRTVRDAALMFSAMARWDLRDPFCLPDDPRDWCDGIEDGVSGLTVGILRNPGFNAPVDADGTAAVERAAQVLTDAGAFVEEADAGLPETSSVFGRVWGAALARLVAGMPAQLVGLLDPGIREVAQTLGGMTAIDFMDAEATRAAAGHAMARLHQRYDLVLCPTVPAGPPLAEAPTVDPVRALWTAWAPWTFTFNLTRQPAITVPMGPRADGMPNSVQIAAAQFRDDWVLRAARAIEVAQPFQIPDLG
ncbi:amidase family protein [Acidisphaera sp. S103]|uniref:amidase family protein n=1 Tax=Acidisphaera sp. S103 TaxID=1747223 RepID=UPI00131C6BB3|nr:amidase family protein [Acidisphaera sp. S103]